MLVGYGEGTFEQTKGMGVFLLKERLNQHIESRGDCIEERFPKALTSTISVMFLYALTRGTCI